MCDTAMIDAGSVRKSSRRSMSITGGRMVQILQTQHYEQGTLIRIRSNCVPFELVTVAEHDDAGSPIGYSYVLKPLATLYRTEQAAIERATRDAVQLTTPEYLVRQTDVDPLGRSRQ